MNVFATRSGRTLEQATTDFLQGLQQNNPGMKAIRSRVQTRVDGAAALLHEFSNDSPAGGKERDVITPLAKSSTRCGAANRAWPTCMQHPSWAVSRLVHGKASG